MKTKFVITPIQTDIEWENVSINLTKFDNLLSEIEDTDLVVFPEMFTTGFTLNTKLAESMDGRTVKWMMEWSKKKNFHICGSIIVEEKGNFYNRFILVSPTGEINFYDKRHLFGFAGESKNFTSGDDRVIWNICGWKICPMVCYDLRFPVWSRNRGDYDVLIYVASWPDQRCEIWRTLLRARAIENQSYVLGVNRVGVDAANLEYNGFTSLISPLGEPLYEVSQNPIVQNLEINKWDLQLIRSKYPFLSDGDKFEIL